MKRSVPGESAIIFISSDPIDTAHKFHLALIQVQKMRIKDFLICHNKISLFAKCFLSFGYFGVELDIL